MTGSKPSWLPDPLCLSSWTDRTYDALYELFCLDFVKSKPVYKGRNIMIPMETEDGKEKIFWHLTSREDRKKNQRLPDLARAARLIWIKPILEQAGQQTEILDFECFENGRIIDYVWLEEHDFIVIMKKLKNGSSLLLTAYSVEEYKKKDFFLKYANRIK